MSCIIDRPSHHQAATGAEDAVLVASLELSRSKWLVTSVLPGSEKMSKHAVPAGDGAALLALLARRRREAEARAGGPAAVVTIQEAGLDGFWLHRLLEKNGIESHVVDAASVAVPRQKRRAKSDGIDGETLLRTLLAWRRGEPRVCSMVVPPSPEEEDDRRLVRERAALLADRIRVTNRIHGLLASQGIYDYDPQRRDRRERLDELTTGDGRELPPHMKTELCRALDHLELLLKQIKEVEAERDRLVRSAEDGSPAALLTRLRALGPEFAAVLSFEGLYRRFTNRRQVAAYAGLAPSPWQSGRVERDQGISKAGNPRLRKTMIELAWLWLRYQPDSALSRWFRARVGSERGRTRRIAVVALARKLLVALWRYVTDGVVPAGAELKAA
jgi:transposase